MSSLTVAIRIKRNLENSNLVNVVYSHDNSIKISDKFSKNRHGAEKLHTFSFDFCFNEDTSQIEIFDALSPLVLHNFVVGTNSCIIAYGQTGSGKTYTMLGSEAVLSDADSSNQYCQASFYEVYNEKVRDLLLSNKGQNNVKVRVREHPSFGPYVSGLSWHQITSKEDIAFFLETGCKARSCSLTNMHNSSSRSHAIFTIIKKQITISQGDIFGTKICLVDLAGSEKPKHQSTRAQVKEGAHINKSLATLGSVILSLSSQKHKDSGTEKYIPYRNSTLTWLLKDCIGGSARTTMIGTICTSLKHYPETLNTLRYAHKAKEIVQRASYLFEKSSNNNSIHLINDLQLEVERLKKFIEEKISHPIDGALGTATKNVISRSVMTSPAMDTRNTEKDHVVELYKSKIDNLEAELENYRLILKERSVDIGDESPAQLDDQDTYTSPRPLKFKLEKKIERLEQKLAQKRQQMADVDTDVQEIKPLESSQVAWWVDYIPARDSPLSHSWISMDFTESKNSDRFAYSVPVSSKKRKPKETQLSETLYPKALKDANRPTFSFLKKTTDELALNTSYRNGPFENRCSDQMGKSLQSSKRTENPHSLRYTNSYHFEHSAPWPENESTSAMDDFDVEKLYLDAAAQEDENDKVVDSKFAKLTQSFIHIPDNQQSKKKRNLSYSFTSHQSSKTSDRPSFSFLKKQTSAVETEDKENHRQNTIDGAVPEVEYGVRMNEFKRSYSLYNYSKFTKGNTPPQNTFYHLYHAADKTANHYIEKCFNELYSEKFRNNNDIISEENAAVYVEERTSSRKTSDLQSLSKAYRSLGDDSPLEFHNGISDSEESDIGTSYQRVPFDALNTSSATPYGSSFSSQSLVNKEVDHFSPTNFWTQNLKLNFEDDETEVKDITPNFANERSKSAKKVVRARAELRRLRHHSNSSSASEHANSARVNENGDEKVKVDKKGFVYDVNAPSDMASFNGDSVELDSDKEDMAANRLKRSSIFLASFNKDFSDDDAESIAEELQLPDENNNPHDHNSLYVDVSDVENDDDLFGTSSFKKAANMLDEKLPLSFMNSNLTSDGQSIAGNGLTDFLSGSMRKSQSYVTQSEFEDSFNKSLEKKMSNASLKKYEFKKNFEFSPVESDGFNSVDEAVVKNSPSKEALVIHVKLIQRTQGTLHELPDNIASVHENSSSTNLLDLESVQKQKHDFNFVTPGSNTNSRHSSVTDTDDRSHLNSIQNKGINENSNEKIAHSDDIHVGLTRVHMNGHLMPASIPNVQNKESDSSALSRSFSSDFESETTVNEVSPSHRNVLKPKDFDSIPVKVLRSTETGLTTWPLFDNPARRPSQPAEKIENASTSTKSPLKPALSWAWTESHSQKRNNVRQKFFEPMAVQDLTDETDVSTTTSSSDKIPVQQTKSHQVSQSKSDNITVHPRLFSSFDLGSIESSSNSPQHVLLSVIDTPTKTVLQPTVVILKKYQDNLSTIIENGSDRSSSSVTNLANAVDNNQPNLLKASLTESNKVSTIFEQDILKSYEHDEKDLLHTWSKPKQTIEEITAQIVKKQADKAVPVGDIMWNDVFNGATNAESSSFIKENHSTEEQFSAVPFVSDVLGQVISPQNDENSKKNWTPSEHKVTPPVKTSVPANITSNQLMEKEKATWSSAANVPAKILPGQNVDLLTFSEADEKHQQHNAKHGAAIKSNPGGIIIGHGKSEQTPFMPNKSVGHNSTYLDNDEHGRKNLHLAGSNTRSDPTKILFDDSNDYEQPSATIVTPNEDGGKREKFITSVAASIVTNDKSASDALRDKLFSSHAADVPGTIERGQNSMEDWSVTDKSFKRLNSNGDYNVKKENILVANHEQNLKELKKSNHDGQVNTHESENRNYDKPGNMEQLEGDKTHTNKYGNKNPSTFENIFAGRELQRIAFVESNGKENVVKDGKSQLLSHSLKSDQPQKIESNQPRLSSSNTFENNKTTKDEYSLFGNLQPLFPFNYLQQITSNQSDSDTDSRKPKNNTKADHIYFDPSIPSTSTGNSDTTSTGTNDHDMAATQNGSKSLDFSGYPGRGVFMTMEQKQESFGPTLKTSTTSKDSNANIAVMTLEKRYSNLTDDNHLQENRNWLKERLPIAVNLIKEYNERESARKAAKEEYVEILKKFMPLPIVSEQLPSKDIEIRRISTPGSFSNDDNYKENFEAYMDKLGKVLPVSGFIVAANSNQKFGQKSSPASTEKSNKRPSFFHESNKNEDPEIARINRKYGSHDGSLNRKPSNIESDGSEREKTLLKKAVSADFGHGMEEKKLWERQGKTVLVDKPTTSAAGTRQSNSAKEEYLSILRKFLPLPLIVDELSGQTNSSKLLEDKSSVAIVAETNYEDSLKTYVETLGKILPFSGYVQTASTIQKESTGVKNTKKKNEEDRENFFQSLQNIDEETRLVLEVQKLTKEKEKQLKRVESQDKNKAHIKEDKEAVITITNRLPTPISPKPNGVKLSGQTTSNNNYFQSLSSIFPIPLFTTSVTQDHSDGTSVDNEQSKSNNDINNPLCFSGVTTNILLRDLEEQNTHDFNAEQQRHLEQPNKKYAAQIKDSSKAEEDILHVTVIDGIPHVQMRQDVKDFEEDEYDEAIDLSIHSDDEEDVGAEKDFKNGNNEYFDPDDVAKTPQHHIDLDERHPDEILYYFNKKFEKIVDPALNLPLSRSLDFTETSADSYVPLSNRLSDSYPNVNSDRSNKAGPPAYTPYSNSSVSRDSLKLDFKDYFNDTHYQNDEDDSDTRRKKSVSWSDLRAGQSLELGPVDGNHHSSPLKPIIKRGSVTIEPTVHTATRHFDTTLRRNLASGSQFTTLQDSVMVTKSALNLETSRDVYVQTDPPPPTRSVSTVTFPQYDERMIPPTHERVASPSPNVSMENLKRYQAKSLLSDLMSLVHERDQLLKDMDSDLSFWQKPGSSYQSTYGKQFMNDQWWKLWRVKYDLDKRIQELFAKMKSYQLSEIPHSHIAWLNVPHSALLTLSAKQPYEKYMTSGTATNDKDCNRIHMSPFDYEKKLANLRRTLVSTSNDLKQTASFPDLQFGINGSKTILKPGQYNIKFPVSLVDESPQSILDEARKLRELSQSLLKETRQSLHQPHLTSTSVRQNTISIQPFRSDYKSREDMKIDDEIQLLRNQYKKNEFVGRSNFKF